MIASGQTIRRLGIFEPFHERTKHEGMTFGLGPAGYDVRVEFDGKGLCQYADVEPGDFILASTVEHFTMPDNLLGVVHDKSSWVRKGIAVHNTVIEPGWKGFLTLEIANQTLRRIRIQRGAPIAQIIFHYLDEPAIPYDGKYQDQERGPQQAR